jgi:O-acetyl-ADP-ribose deacetylase (regulator of RNase III)
VLTTIQYVTGDATSPIGEGPKVIVHCCNDAGGWARGFVLALSARWPEPEASYRAWYRRGQQGTADFHLGMVEFVPVEEGLHVANLIGQHGMYPDAQGRPPIRYDAIQDGLREVRYWIAGTDTVPESVHMPRMGAGLAGGEWRQIARIIEVELCMHGVPVTVYDLPS